jgi:hypothetical protein
MKNLFKPVFVFALSSFFLSTSCETKQEIFNENTTNPEVLDIREIAKTNYDLVSTVFANPKKYILIGDNTQKTTMNLDFLVDANKLELHNSLKQYETLKYDASIFDNTKAIFSQPNQNLSSFSKESLTHLYQDIDKDFDIQNMKTVYAKIDNIDKQISSNSNISVEEKKYVKQILGIILAISEYCHGRMVHKEAFARVECDVNWGAVAKDAVKGAIVGGVAVGINGFIAGGAATANPVGAVVGGLIGGFIGAFSGGLLAGTAELISQCI